MPQSVTIPATLVLPGTTVLGSVQPDSGDNSFIIFIDRTIPGGLNATPAGGNPWAFTFGVDISTDGGSTWTSGGACTCPGSDQQSPFNDMDGQFPATGNRRVRAWFTVPAGITTLLIAGSAQTGVNLSAP